MRSVKKTNSHMSIKSNPSPFIDDLFAFLFKTAKTPHDLKLEHVADDTVDTSRPFHLSDMQHSAASIAMNDTLNNNFNCHSA